MLEKWLKGLAEEAMITIKKYCNIHPTCEGCAFRKKHIGCSFRGKSPSEWKSEGDNAN